VFIRAPAILTTGKDVDVLASMQAVPHESAREQCAHVLGGEHGKAVEVAVAVRQRNILATAFHPELTADDRWHQLFLKIIAGDG